MSLTPAQTLYRPHFALLDRSACQRIHDASLRILERTGVRIFHQGALALLQEAGGIVTDGNLVRLSPQLVESVLGKAPAAVTLYERGSGTVAVDLSENRVSFGPGSDCFYYLEPRERARRRFTSATVASCVRLCDALPQIGFVMSMGIPEDVPTEQQYRRQYALMLANTTKPTVFVADGKRDCEAIVAMASAAAGGTQQLQRHPTLLLYSEPTTPLKHSESATEKLLYMAEMRLPVVHSPAPMMGGTAPVTLAGGMALGNAEVLSSLLLHQLTSPGAPFVYGSGLHHLDMRTTISVYGAPEFQLARAMVADMARFYSLPSWGYAACSDSPAMDEQAAADAAIQVRDALLMGTNLVHDVGYLDAGLTTSPELIVFTAEMIDMHRRFLEGVRIDEESLALDVIDEVGPGGHFLNTDHTLGHYRSYWYPTLFERRRLEGLKPGADHRLSDRLRSRTLALLDKHQPQELPAAVVAEIDAILAQV